MKGCVMPKLHISKTKFARGYICAGLVLSLSLSPLSVHAMDFEDTAVRAADAVQINGAVPTQNAAAALNNSANWTAAQTNKAARKTASAYDHLLDYQKSKRPLGNQLKATLSPSKIPGVTKAKRTAAVMSIPAILLIFTFIISLWGLGRSGAYERN